MGKRWLLGTEALLYAAFLCLDLTGTGPFLLSGVLKYAGVLLCFFHVLLKKGSREILAGLFFTILADFFLLFTDNSLPGVLLFLCVQICYSILLFRGETVQRICRRVAVRFFFKCGASLLLLALLSAAGIQADALLFVTAVYFFSLLENTVRAWLCHTGLFAVGMGLFLLCDIQVGLFNLSSYLPEVGQIGVWYRIASVGMWACYLPAKVCIALAGVSGFPQEGGKKKKTVENSGK